ncbi:MAG: ATP-grasp domain-containing protein [Candidatus Lindowbacteria bacterium]|nr:ATP-grasp domain-containing protein [Candidatus Lindowbacteria bacterium]
MTDIKGRVIMTFSRGWQSLAAVRSLGELGIEVVTGDEYALTPASFSKYSIGDFRYPNVSTDPEGFLDVLEETILKYKPEDPSVPYVLMPIHKETYLIAEHRERFEPHIRVPVPDIDAILQVHNKGTMAAYAMEKGLTMPRTLLPKSSDDVREHYKELEAPVFIKLRESAAGVGIEKIDDIESIPSVFDRFLDEYGVSGDECPVLQQGVPGDDYCVTTLFDKGKLVCCMTYHNLRAYPADKGAGVMRETVEAPIMEKISQDILGPLNWHGVAQIDFRWDGKPDSDPYLIEVNPRFWGGLIQAIESGWNYPWLLFQLAAYGKITETEEARFDVRTETPILALLATLQEIADNDEKMDQLKNAWALGKQEFKDGSKRQGIKDIFSGLKETMDVKARLKEAKELLSQHRGNVYDVLSGEDPMPVFGILYPLAVFMKHGKVNMELMTSEGVAGTAKN